MLLGREIGYIKKLFRPSDFRNPEGSPPKLMTQLEKLYIRFFGVPDTIKQQQAREVLSIITKTQFKSVIDVGCGQGYYSTMIARKYPNCQVKGIDINPEKVKAGKQVIDKFGLKNLFFEQRDACSDPLNNKYDLILMLQIIEHLEGDTFLLNKLRKNMKKDGHLIVTAPNKDSPLIKWYERFVTIDSHVRDGYSMNELMTKISNAGFKIKQVKRLSSMIGQTIEKAETHIKIRFPLLFPLLYPLLYYLSFLDDYLKPKIETSSGILIVASLK